MKAKPSAEVSIPPAEARVLKLLAQQARRLETPLYAVGGCVRDWDLGRRTFDLDLAVVGDPGPLADRCARLLNGRAEAFGSFGTRRVIGPGRLRVDVATTRCEEYPQPASLPRLTATAVAIERDLVRRDFSINAMAVRLDDGSRALVDPCGGMRDLKARTLRALHPASFRDDPTRVFRAARFIGRLRYRPAEEMSEQAREALRAGHAARLSRHRLLHELVCLLGERDPGFAFALLETWGYLPLLHPELPWRQKLPPGVEPRLAALALALGPSEGARFVGSFPFEHRLRGLLQEALATAFSDGSPRKALPVEVFVWVRRALPKLAPAALKPCFLLGEDLIAAGVKPGPEFRAILDEAAALQRRGRLKTRAAALAWLRRR